MWMLPWRHPHLDMQSQPLSFLLCQEPEKNWGKVFPHFPNHHLWNLLNLNCFRPWVRHYSHDYVPSSRRALEFIRRHFGAKQISPTKGKPSSCPSSQKLRAKLQRSSSNSSNESGLDKRLSQTWKRDVQSPSRRRDQLLLLRLPQYPHLRRVRHPRRAQGAQRTDHKEVIPNHNRQIRRSRHPHQFQDRWPSCRWTVIGCLKVRGNGLDQHDKVENGECLWGHSSANRQERERSHVERRHFYGAEDQRDGVLTKNPEWKKYCLEPEHRWSQNSTLITRWCWHFRVFCPWVS